MARMPYPMTTSSSAPTIRAASSRSRNVARVSLEGLAHHVAGGPEIAAAVARQLHAQAPRELRDARDVVTGGRTSALHSHQPRSRPPADVSLLG